MEGIFYICGTPIGNLEDITFRQLRILKEVDIIFAEDTRHTLKLLNYYNIKNKLISYNEHNKKEKGLKIINYLLEGKNIALVTDCGMPSISDPGEDIINLCYENNINITIVPGPTAVISALVLSGLSSRSYIFEGFLPKNKKEIKKVMKSLKDEERTIIFHESPHRLLKTLNTFKDYIDHTREIAVVREITKKYEEVIKMSLEDIINYFTLNEPRGEIVLIISACNNIKNSTKDFSDMDIQKHLEIYMSQNYTKKEAMKLVAKDRNVSKSDVYRDLLK